MIFDPEDFMWTSTTKGLGVSKVVPHATTRPNVSGRPPGISTIQFSPIALFGAAARCSNLHVVNPTIVTPESVVVSSLVEQHVDNSNPDFAILASADTLKDFIKSYFAGTVAAGLGYLVMINDGYTWVDHFENLGGGSASTGKTPDFAFAGSVPGVALMESKGSRSAASGAFDTTVKDGYINQVEPHLGSGVGTAQATHGYCIGAYLKPTTKAELRIHHTAAPAFGGGASVGDPGSVAAVQRGNYATAFTMAHSERLGRQIRSGESPERVPFVQFDWKGRRWVTSYVVGGFGYGPGYFMDEYPEVERMWPRWWALGELRYGYSFAIEQNIARTVLRHFAAADGKVDRPVEIERLQFEAGGGDEQESGSIYPDGLAVLGADAKIDGVRPTIWERAGSDFRHI